MNGVAAILLVDDDVEVPGADDYLLKPISAADLLAAI